MVLEFIRHFGAGSAVSYRAKFTRLSRLKAIAI